VLCPIDLCSTCIERTYTFYNTQGFGWKIIFVALYTSASQSETVFCSQFTADRTSLLRLPVEALVIFLTASMSTMTQGPPSLRPDGYRGCYLRGKDCNSVKLTFTRQFKVLLRVSAIRTIYSSWDKFTMHSESLASFTLCLVWNYKYPENTGERRDKPALLRPLERTNSNPWSSEGPKRVGVSRPSSENRNRFIFRNFVFTTYLEF
jgi:hypothetical protein